MPVRVTIHSSVVSTMPSRSALVRVLAGTREPVPSTATSRNRGLSRDQVLPAEVSGFIRRDIALRPPLGRPSATGRVLGESRRPLEGYWLELSDARSES